MRERIARRIAAYVARTRPHPGRGLLCRLAWWLDPADLAREIAPGVRMKVRLGNEMEVGYWTGFWEEHGEAGVLLARLHEGGVFVDVGANLGVYTLLAAMKVGPSGRVYAFEPVPAVHRRLCENVALNRLANVTVLPLGLSDARRRADLFLGKNDAQGSLFQVEGQTIQGKVGVDLETLDTVVREQGIGRIDAIKIDVEGAEWEALRGMKGVLGRREKPILLIEINFTTLASAGVEPTNLFSTVTEFGYRAFLVRHGRTIPVERVAAPRSRWDGYSPDSYLFEPLARAT